MLHKIDMFEDVVDKQTLKIKDYALAFKLKQHIECDPNLTPMRQAGIWE